MTKWHMPGLGPDAEVFDFTPRARYHRVQFGFRIWRWFIPLGRAQRIRCR